MGHKSLVPKPADLTPTRMAFAGVAVRVSGCSPAGEKPPPPTLGLREAREGGGARSVGLGRQPSRHCHRGPSTRGSHSNSEFPGTRALGEVHLGGHRAKSQLGSD